MKACIVTVYNSENCGSYWQAYALKAYIESLGFQVFFLKRNMRGASHSPKTVFRKFIGNIRRKQFKRAVGHIIQYFTFEKVISVFETVLECDESFDVCILGSDTIWNLDDAYFAGERKTYWGQRSKAHKTISYAASIANTQSSKIKSFPEVIEYLEKLDDISIRDHHTIDVLSEYTNKELKLVCDPTLLFDKDYYSSFCKSNNRGAFIFVYYFGRMPIDLENEIRSLSKETNMKIVVMGNSMIGDEQLFAYSPFDFIECFCHARYVVTNTFHGTLFSIIFEKNVLFNSDGKQKVRDILNRVGLSHRDYSNGANLGKAFKLDDIDYDTVRSKVMEYKRESTDFLRKAIMGDVE